MLTLTAGLAAAQNPATIPEMVDDEATRIVSAGFEVAFPTGSEVRGLGRGTTMFEPYLATGTSSR